MVDKKSGHSKSGGGGKEHGNKLGQDEIRKIDGGKGNDGTFVSRDKPVPTEKPTEEKD